MSTAQTLLRRVLDLFGAFYAREPYGMHIEEQNLMRDIRLHLQATPAPESTAPARTDLDWDLINRVSKAPAQSFMAPEVGTGSETSPDAGASIREALRKLDQACQDLGRAALPVWDYNPPEYLRKEWEALADVLAEIGSLSVAKPAEASDAEQIPIPHPVAEAEHSSPSQPLPEWFDKPQKHPDYCDPCHDDTEAVLNWQFKHVEMLEKLVKSLAKPQPPELLDGARLVWTMEKPTQEGNYWRRTSIGIQSIVDVAKYEDHFAIDRGWGYDPLGEMCEWAGPIPEPLAQAPTRTQGKGK